MILAALLMTVSAYGASYEDRLRAIESSAVIHEDCDDAGIATRLRVVRDLDRWTNRTHDPDSSDEKSDEFGAGDPDGWIQIGPLKLQPRTREATETGWEEQVYSWSDAEATRRSAMAAGDDSNPKWKLLRREVIRLLDYDRRRRVDQQDLSLRHSHVEIGNAVRDSMDRCSNDEISGASCSSFETSGGTRTLLRENATFEKDFQAWKNASSRLMRAKSFHLLHDFVQFLADYETPRKTEGIAYREGVLEVRMQAGDFAGYEKDLARVIEKFWNRLSDALRIRWVQSVDSFIFRFLDRPGAPSNTNRTKQIVTLAAESRESSPAHEFGHVLGFRDHYFNVWRSETCSYAYQFLNGDLMSEVSKGVVLPGHWTALRRVYGGEDR